MAFEWSCIKGVYNGREVGVKWACAVGVLYVDVMHARLCSVMFKCLTIISRTFSKHVSVLFHWKNQPVKNDFTECIFNNDIIKK